MASVDTVTGSIESLAEAMEKMVALPARSRPLSVTVASVRVRDAAALGELVQVHRREAMRNKQAPSKVHNEPAVEHLVGAAALLLLLDDALLPALDEEPCFNRALIEALADCGNELRKRATLVGGSFDTEAGALCDLIAGWHKCNPPQMPQALMRNYVRDMVKMVRDLLESTCSIAANP